MKRNRLRGASQSKPRTTEELFQVIKDRVRLKLETGCWVWLGRDDSGYGEFLLRSVKDGSRPEQTITRLLWFILHGPIPADKRIQRVCNNQSCVNPDHLYLGATQNKRRLTEDQVEWIKRVYKPMHPHFNAIVLASKLGVSPTLIYYVLRGKLKTA